MEGDAREAIGAVWRIESARVIARVARLVGDLELAEDFAQDALVAALEQWPDSGIPLNPGAWLTTVARRRAIDHVRKRNRHASRASEIGYEYDARQEANRGDPDASLDDPVGDELLGLIFVCCHPVLARDARVALTLRLLGGLTTDEIARGFLVPKATLAQRIVRAKRTLREARVPFEVPRGAELVARLGSVLEVVYLIFNEGYAATSGDDWVRPELCREALRLGRVLAGLAADAPEVHGLVALMEIQASRLAARTGPDGEAVLLMEQDRSRWDHVHIRRGLEALARAQALGGGLGPYALQAAIAACHARARTAEDTDWPRIAALYDALVQVAPSPVVALNRAVAVGMAYGAEAGLELVDALADETGLQDYPHLPAVRGHLLDQLGRLPEAREAFERAATLSRNEAERAILRRRAGGGRSVESSCGPRRKR